jgi:hypothetical protein
VYTVNELLSMLRYCAIHRHHHLLTERLQIELKRREADEVSTIGLYSI